MPCELVSAIISLISGKNTGKFADQELDGTISAQDVTQAQRSTGQFPTRVNRKIGPDNSESLDRYQGKGFPSGRHLLEGVTLRSNILHMPDRILQVDHRTGPLHVIWAAS